MAIEGNQVTIGAEVKREAEKKEGDRVLRSERYFGSVYRSFTLPVETRRGREHREVRQRHAGADAGQEGAGRRSEADGPVAGAATARRGGAPGRAGERRRLSRAPLALARQRTRLTANSSSMLSRKKLHGDDAVARRRQVSSDTPAYSKVPGGEFDHQRASRCVVAGGPQAAAVHLLHLHGRSVGLALAAARPRCRTSIAPRPAPRSIAVAGVRTGRVRAARVVAIMRRRAATGVAALFCGPRRIGPGVVPCRRCAASSRSCSGPVPSGR